MEFYIKFNTIEDVKSYEYTDNEVVWIKNTFPKVLIVQLDDLSQDQFSYLMRNKTELTKGIIHFAKNSKGCDEGWVKKILSPLKGQQTISTQVLIQCDPNTPINNYLNHHFSGQLIKFDSFESIKPHIISYFS